jgi:guanylate kinase
MTETLRSIVICRPSGSGKSTFFKNLKEKYPTSFTFCVSHTNRMPRVG